MEVGKKWGKKTGLLIWVLIVVVALSACTLSGNKKDKGALGSLDREDTGSLKIAYFNEQAFFMQYGNAFQAMFPNVTLEVISTESALNAEDPVAELEKLLDEQKPDAMFLGEDQYAALAKRGKLYDLDAVVKQDEFDLDSFHPAVIELLKAQGGGKLYGLSPNFNSQALYYNKDLFDQHGIPYPTDGMSWEEVMQLASRFPVKKDGDDAFNGLAQSSETSNPFELIITIGIAKGLLFADLDTKTLSFETPEWKSVFQSVIDGYKSGSISMPSEGGGEGGRSEARGIGGKMMIRFGPDSMHFMSSQAAMTIDGPELLNMMDMGKGMKDGGGGGVKVEGGGKGGGQSPFKDINWDVVTLPVDPSQPDVSTSMNLEGVFSINASSENLPAAWEFLKYVNGEQLAKTSSMSSPGLSARTAYKKVVEGKNMDAFYALGANEQRLLLNLPEDFINSFGQLAVEQIKKVVEETQSVDEAMKLLQTQGQDLLTKAMLDAEN
jgi:multiple sugar transport system substrate-binding protein